MAEEAIIIGGNNTIVLKKALARILYCKGIDQSKISQILSLSQPMVSNYCSSKEKIPHKINKIAEQISSKILDGYPVNFQCYVSFSDKIVEGNYYIADKNEIISDETSKVVDNLNQAFSMLKGKDISGIIPKVKINIAMAKENATDTSDIAAFLNGLMLVDDKITGHNGIRFGKSKHLSSLLLDLKQKICIHAIMNIAYIEDPENTNYNIEYLTKDFNLKEAKKDIDILLHKGDFGIEPCAYVLGKDAVDVSKKVIQILDGIKNEK